MSDDCIQGQAYYDGNYGAPPGTNRLGLIQNQVLTQDQAYTISYNTNNTQPIEIVINSDVIQELENIKEKIDELLRKEKAKKYQVWPNYSPPYLPCTPLYNPDGWLFPPQNPLNPNIPYTPYTQDYCVMDEFYKNNPGFTGPLGLYCTCKKCNPYSMMSIAP